MKLLFIYNAEAGLAAGIMDSIHKLLSPSTYPCDLCAITYGLTSMKAEWREWLGTLTLPVHFYHRADFRRDWPNVEVTLPAIMAERDGKLELLVSAADFKSVTQVSQLIKLLEPKLAELRA